MTLKELLEKRGVRMEAAALLAGTNKSTVSRIANGRRRARPETVVRLATALGTSALRMQALCDASWQAAHSGSEEVPVG